MKLPKAIEILSDHDNLTLVFKNPDLHAAVKLGIEALNRLQRNRSCEPEIQPNLLPGEDKDTGTPAAEAYLSHIKENTR